MKYAKAGTGVAVEVLKLLDEETKQSPGMMDDKLPYAIGSIKAALHYLLSLGHVSRVARGLYVITELGTYVLHQLSRRSE